MLERQVRCSAAGLQVLVPLVAICSPKSNTTAHDLALHEPRPSYGIMPIWIAKSKWGADETLTWALLKCQLLQTL